MKPIAGKNITLTGELAFRVGRNFSRLETPIYRPEKIFGADQSGWPGDWEGRTMLALCLNESLSGRKAAYLDAIVEALEGEWNEKGYLKDVYPEGVINEQQLSGHNWLLRGILELYLETKDEKYHAMAKRIVENLYLPLRGSFASYPVAPGSRSLTGGASGHIVADNSHNWMLSSDIGCAFISFDALGQYYQIFGGEALGQLLDEMFRVFSTIDFVKSSVQTHATLSALRGVLRYYEVCGESRLLDFAQKLFDVYLSNGMTENYANYNWFGRPTWTEPCAIVDSYMVAIQLFRLTRKAAYVTLANKIYYNALLASQRLNGGFGCDTCAGTEKSGVFLQVNDGIFEAFWCCSMRGAEGLSSAAGNAVLEDGDDLYLTNYISGEFRTEKRTVTIRSRYPYENGATISVKGLAEPVKLHLYVPEEASDIVLTQAGAMAYTREENFVTVTVAEETPVELRFALGRTKKPLVGALTVQEGFVEWAGDLIVAYRADGSETFLCDRVYGEKEADMKVTMIQK